MSEVESQAENDAVKVRALLPSDAERLTACFERTYGRSYAHEVYVDPAVIRERLAQGRLHSAVAVTADGEIVGHIGLILRRDGDVTVDGGGTVVDSRYRNRGLVRRLGARILPLFSELDLLGYHHYPVTTHDIIQRVGAAGGDVELGLMLAYSPALDAAARSDVVDACIGERTAALMLYHATAEAPEREVHLPDAHAEMIRSVLVRAGVSRRYLAHDGRCDRGAKPAVDLTVEKEAGRGLVRLTVEHAGNDSRVAAGALTEAVTEAARSGVELIHLDIPLAGPDALGVVGPARDLGFFFCGVLPEYRDGDVLRLQRLEPGVSESPVISLHTDRARELLSFVQTDRASVANG